MFLTPGAAIAHGLELIGEGADILDVGGESTRPGAEPVSVEEELRRVMPVVEGTRRGRRGRADLDRHLQGVGGRAGTRRRREPGQRRQRFCAPTRGWRAGGGQRRGVLPDAHARRAPHDAATTRATRMSCDEVKAFLEERMAFAVGEGVREDRIMLDPGIGFGKTVAHNLELLARLDELTALGRPIVIGTSRKSFFGRILADAAGRAEPLAAADRLPGTIATNVLAFERGASVFRVHDVAPVRDALAVAAATLGGRWTASKTRTPTSYGVDGPEGGEDADDPAGAGARGEEPGYMDRPDETDPYPLGDEEDEDEDEFDSEREETARVGHDRDRRPLAVHPPRRQRGRARGRPAAVLDLRLDVGEADATVTDASRTRSTTPRSASWSR